MLALDTGATGRDHTAFELGPGQPAYVSETRPAGEARTEQMASIGARPWLQPWACTDRRQVPGAIAAGPGSAPAPDLAFA